MCSSLWPAATIYMLFSPKCYICDMGIMLHCVEIKQCHMKKHFQMLQHDVTFQMLQHSVI